MNVKLLTQSGAFDLVEVKKHLKIQIIIIIIKQQDFLIYDWFQILYSNYD